MISTAASKLIRSLHLKKYRDLHRLYLVEGEKMFREMLSMEGRTGHVIQKVFATQEFILNNPGIVKKRKFEIIEAGESELKKVSALVSPQAVLALVSIPPEQDDMEELGQSTVLAFESIRDPGNLGTIMRTADWFGIRHIVCTPDSVDVYNPKVVQSTMGAIARVKIHYREFTTMLKDPFMKGKSVYGTYLDGENIYGTTLPENLMILFGNESRGLSAYLAPFIDKKITIPSYSGEKSGPESLNVASSVAILCSELRRGNK
jgi:TrmH family RNA methyltransferase